MQSTSSAARHLVSRSLAAALLAGAVLAQGAGEEAKRTTSSPDQAPAVVVAQTGGALTAPRTIFPIEKGSVRDHVIVATSTGLHLYVLFAVDDETVELHYAHSPDKAKTWTASEKLAVPVDVRAKWVKAFALPAAPDATADPVGKAGAATARVTLVIGSDPSLGPRTPRITHFMGKKLQGFVGMLWVVRLQADARTLEDQHPLRLENPGSTIYSQFPFRPSFELMAHGDRLSLVGTSVFRVRRGGGTSQIWSLVSAHSTDRGKTWSKVSFREKAYPGLRMLRPAMVRGAVNVNAVFGDRFDKMLVQFEALADGGWREASSDLAKLSQWNYWYDALDEGDTVVVTDTVETKSEPKPRFGIVEFASRDGGKTWGRRRTIDLDLAQAYAAHSYREGKTRAHVAWDVAALSVDDGKSWIKVAVSGAFRTGHAMLIPSRGLAISAVDRVGETSAVRLVIFSP